ncbi:cytochrome C biogenesis protein [Vibrio navarrensis]|uniref:carbohydrate ABC transporter permease n=1 Tax=Vibrio navarrensis TaxID=29495 RepID=UPI001DD9B7D6|nr:cytochrome C biogenesis protein [Vibrio navarrensis]MBE4573214.1 cytochrome C biogenesis protein [Vibrio navarrensis]MBE4577004.1 cytochrome C biogenesis protein [Vibrio navarrensis]MBE4587546.1 cytochrome C biogenesis protein [Vibrio navarrensis]MBE4595916.1 cytochrome C biogenesis protein [Vibrio navarrensis]
MKSATSNVMGTGLAARIFSYLNLKALTPYAFLLPFLLIFSIFGVFPLLFSIYLSFHSWNPVEGLGAMSFVGLENYHVALTDPWLWRSLENTFWLAITSGVAQHLIAIPVAYILVSLGGRLRHWLTSAYFLPYITSTVAASLIFFNMYSPSSGIINQTLIALADSPLLGWAFSWVNDFQPIRWLDDATMIKPSIAIMVFWKYTGFNIVLYTTGLMTIPKEILEAARMDGANAFRRFWNISLPMIRPFIFFAVTMTIIGNLQLFEEPFVLTRGGGGTGQAGLTISMYLYKVGWEWLEMGTASAISWLLFALIATCTLVQFFFFGKKGLGEH